MVVSEGDGSTCRRRASGLSAALGASCVALALASPAIAAKGMAIGIFDDAATLDPAKTTFPTLRALHVQVVRMTLVWGGPGGVANTRPAHAADPTDPAYQWTRYDHAIERATAAGM